MHARYLNWPSCSVLATRRNSPARNCNEIAVGIRRAAKAYMIIHRTIIHLALDLPFGML